MGISCENAQETGNQSSVHWGPQHANYCHRSHRQLWACSVPGSSLVLGGCEIFGEQHSFSKTHQPSLCQARREGIDRMCGNALNTQVLLSAEGAGLIPPPGTSPLVSKESLYQGHPTPKTQVSRKLSSGLFKIQSPSRVGQVVPFSKAHMRPTRAFSGTHQAKSSQRDTTDLASRNLKKFSART